MTVRTGLAALLGGALLASPALASEVDMQETLDPARMLNSEDAEFWLLTEGGGGYADGGKLRPFRLTTHYDEGARIERDQIVAWQDIYGGVDCAAREIYMGTTVRYTAAGKRTGGDLPGDDVEPVEPGTIGAAVADGLCNGAYSVETVVPAQSYAKRAAFARRYFEHRRSRR